MVPGARPDLLDPGQDAHARRQRPLRRAAAVCGGPGGCVRHPGRTPRGADRAARRRGQPHLQRGHRRRAPEREGDPRADRREAPDMSPDPRNAAILGGNRIPFARRDREYARASNQDMLTAALDGLIARFGLQDERLGEVAGGGVLKRSRDFNLTRECVLGSALSPETPAYDVQQACGTSLETTIHIANKIALGQIESGIAGGADTTSDAPIELNEDLRRLLLDLNRTRSTTGRLGLLGRLRPGQVVPATPRNEEPRTGLSMGEHQAISTRRWGITREDQDEIAVESHRRLAAAYDRGFFDDLITPYLGLERDGILRADASMEKLAQLKP